MLIKFVRFGACLVLASFSLSSIPAEAANLGLALQILQGENSKSGIENNSRLWFVIQPGTTKSRSIIVKSTSSVAQKVKISIGAVKRVNGQSQLAIGEKSPTEKWAVFDNQDFTLAPKSEKQVNIGFAIPKSEAINSYSAMLLVKATDAQKSAQTLEYSVPGAAQIAAPIFLGIGTEDEFLTSFEIKRISGINTVKGKALRVEIKNTGKVPVSIQGDVQAIGVTFKTATIGPFYYQTETIQPGESKFADVLVGESIPESKWRLFVTASQGQVTESREFEIDVSYTGSNNPLMKIVMILVPVFFLIALYWSFRTLRNSKRKHASGKPNFNNPQKESIADISDEELKNLIEEFRAQKARKKLSPARKVAVKKAPPKKKVARKASAKKTTTKKAVSKKATVKKGATKKAVSRKKD